ncbi:MAG: hypothetical protein HN742_03370 [Lentisphaerae bacterium]|jgi:purine-nucleoside phosphorylase|nr:hypothetical protein [Lentisphaerota bacterium]MBT4820812.1 hypothetical protein [Lentisphaerota bacterium]MBT5605510.1 hypothetical protein [Lentisphaerota bacterium]MBT7060059.1 hypothetical protein [Lentisphaerota bacterium]MBT7840881.1 hypothetical protein [Lentisphaerota bacterium]
MPALRECAEQAADRLRSELSEWADPRVMVQFGAGFVPAGLLDREQGVLPLSALPGMPDAPSPAGHPLTLTLGTCVGDTQILVAHGRRHLYEGHGVMPCILPIAAAALAGVRTFILIGSTTGAVWDELHPGAWLILTDYVNRLGVSPLVGNLDLIDDPFLDMNETFSQEIISGLVNAAHEIGVTPRLGIYEATMGPQGSTPAEVDAARQSDVAVLGTSLVLEAILARGMGCRVAALAVVSGEAAGHHAKPPTRASIGDANRFASPLIVDTLRILLRDHLSMIVGP